ncbi:hypothetical protein LEN26_011478 [Aphanomyces euteiches]|nr:hypothetical protein LEN26_011478 [Aphanomyces euteiches]KAH9124749.1 hypothetical protein AeMF1_004535 [Aphanomyces euteiches]KAH9185463.1 hypothetical protein AeNC1_012559 [Aphanomyces euteiches]
MRLGIVVALVATSAVVALCQADEASPALLSRQVTPLKEERGRKYGGRIGKVVGGAVLGAVGAGAGAAIGTAAAGPAGTAAGTAGGAVAGVYLGTRLGARGGQRIGGWYGRRQDLKDAARKAANEGNPATKKPRAFGRLAKKIKRKKSAAPTASSKATATERPA